MLKFSIILFKALAIEAIKFIVKNSIMIGLSLLIVPVIYLYAFYTNVKYRNYKSE